MSFGHTLRKFRAARDLSLREFGKLCDIDHAYIHCLERGEAANHQRGERGVPHPLHGRRPRPLPLADERESPLWASSTPSTPKSADSTAASTRSPPQMRERQYAQDDNEVKACKLELVTDRTRNLDDRCDAFEQMCGTAAEMFTSCPDSASLPAARWAG